MRKFVTLVLVNHVAPRPRLVRVVAADAFVVNVTAVDTFTLAAFKSSVVSEPPSSPILTIAPVPNPIAVRKFVTLVLVNAAKGMPRFVLVSALLVTLIAPPTFKLVAVVTDPVAVSVPVTETLESAVTTPVDVRAPDEAMLLKATLLVVPNSMAVLKLVTSVLVRAARGRPRLVLLAAALAAALVPEK